MWTRRAGTSLLGRTGRTWETESGTAKADARPILFLLEKEAAAVTL
jgi:hypothetical protein